MQNAYQVMLAGHLQWVKGTVGLEGTPARMELALCPASVLLVISFPCGAVLEMPMNPLSSSL